MLILCTAIAGSGFPQDDILPVPVVLPDDPIDRIAKPQLEGCVAGLQGDRNIAEGVALHQQPQELPLVVVQICPFDLPIQPHQHT